jgi:hypothetical protein
VHRFLLTYSLGLIVVLAAGSVAAARETVRLPLSCELRNGKVAISRLAQPKLYDIVTTRQRQVYNVCSPEDGTRCRAILVHRFDVGCGADPVPWVEIAAALINENGGHAATKQGRLHVTRAGPSTRGDTRCAERSDSASSYSLDERLPGDPCRTSKGETGWTFPPGYAPLGELGATLIVSVSPNETTQTPGRPKSAIAARDNAPSPAPPSADTPVVHNPDPAVTPNKKETATGVVEQPASRDDGTARQTAQSAPQPPASTESRAPTGPVHVASVPADLAHASAWGVIGQPAAPNAPLDNGDAPVGAPPTHSLAPPASKDPDTRPDETHAADPQPPPAEPDGGGAADGDDAHEAPIMRVVSNVRWTPPVAGEVESWLPNLEPAAVAELVVGQVREIRFERGFATVVMAIALVSGLLTGVGWYASRSFKPRTARAPRITTTESTFPIVVRPTGALAPADAEMCGELCTTAHSLLRQIDQRVDELQGVAPLRRVLQREMRHLEQFLTAVTAASPAEAEEWRRMRNRLQRIVKELMRLKEIVEGAYRSLSGSGFAKNEPRDRHEAYEALGVNADVDSRTLKKLVDALRACWHPDLAKDEPDRVLREERMKRINVAWDIINAKRQEA